MLIPITIGVTFVVFLIMNISPGDPGRMILGLQAPQAAVDALNEEFGINDPFFVRYFDYLLGIFHGDFGVSWRTQTSVIGEIMKLLPNTVFLCSMSIALSLLAGIPIGVISAVKQYSLADNVFRISAMIISCVPSFWLSLIFILVFSVNLKWLPAFGVRSPLGWIMPIVVLSALTIGVIIRLTRSTMLEVIRQDYIRTARAKGAKERYVIINHALRNALIPVITSAATSFGQLLGGTVFIEVIFALPGLGNHIVSAVFSKDVPIVMGSVIVLAIAFTLINLAVDIGYTYLDPRIKSQYVKPKKHKQNTQGLPSAAVEKTI